MGLIMHLAKESGHPNAFWCSPPAAMVLADTQDAVLALEATYVDDHVAMLVFDSADALLTAAPEALHVIRSELTASASS